MGGDSPADARARMNPLVQQNLKMILMVEEFDAWKWRSEDDGDKDGEPGLGSGSGQLFSEEMYQEVWGDVVFAGGRDAWEEEEYEAWEAAWWAAFEARCVATGMGP